MDALERKPAGTGSAPAPRRVGDDDDDFEEEGAATEFMAVKPWLGAIAAPTGSQNRDSSAPRQTLELEFVYGYRGNDCRNNLFYSANGEIAYYASGVGVVYNKSSNTQRFFRDHTDDILCCAISPDRQFMVTGQVSDHTKNPFLAIWRLDDPTRMVRKLERGHQRGVLACAWTFDGFRVVSIGNDDQHSCIMWDARSGAKLAEEKGDQSVILDIVCSRTTNNFVTVGVKHIKLWTIEGNRLVGKRGSVAPKGTIQTALCAAFNSKNDCLVGTFSGDMYIFRGSSLIHTTKLHTGPMYSIHVHNGGIITGGKDGNLVFLDNNLKPLNSINLTNVVPRSIDTNESSILLGTDENNIVEIDRTTNVATRIQDNHFNELWGLATHPRLPLVFSSAVDGTVRVWDVPTRRMIAKEKIGGGSPVGKGKASRAIDISPDGTLLAIGCDDGTTVICEFPGLAQVASIPRDPQNLSKSKNFGISDIKFSPDGRTIAIGGHDMHIDFFTVGQWTRRSGSTGHVCHATITHLDWAKDSRTIVANTGDYELLFFQADGRQITSASSLRDTPYQSWSCVLGWPVQGIFPPNADGTDVNSTARNHRENLLATADDFGKVKLFKYPCNVARASFNEQPGHCSHVTKAAWLIDDSILLTTGGLDACVFQWRVRG